MKDCDFQRIRHLRRELTAEEAEGVRGKVRRNIWRGVRDEESVPSFLRAEGREKRRFGYPKWNVHSESASGRETSSKNHERQESKEVSKDNSPDKKKECSQNDTKTTGDERPTAPSRTSVQKGEIMTST